VSSLTQLRRQTTPCATAPTFLVDGFAPDRRVWTVFPGPGHRLPPTSRRNNCCSLGIIKRLKTHGQQRSSALAVKEGRKAPRKLYAAIPTAAAPSRAPGEASSLLALQLHHLSFSFVSDRPSSPSAATATDECRGLRRRRVLPWRSTVITTFCGENMQLVRREHR